MAGGGVVVVGGTVMAPLAALVLRGPEAWPVLLGALAALAAGLLAFYAPQVRGLPARWRWTLPALRAAAVGTLAFSLLRPALVRVLPPDPAASVLVLLDRSLSMSVADRALSKALSPSERRRVIGQLVTLADALGKLPPGARQAGPEGAGPGVAATPQGLRHLQLRAEDVVRLGRELEYARLSGRDPEEAQQRLDRAIERLVADARAAHEAARASKQRAPVVRALGALAQPPRPEQRDAYVRGGILQAVERAAQEAEGSQDAADEVLFERDGEVAAAVTELSRMSRLALAWEALVAERGGLLSALAPSAIGTAGAGGVASTGYAIGDTVEAVELRRGDGGGPLVEPVATASELRAGLREALARAASGRSVEAVVLFSDGREVHAGEGAGGGGDEDLDLPPGIPVFTVYTASPVARDLAVARVEVPASIFVGEPFSARLHVRASPGLDLSKVTGDVLLHLDDGRSFARRLTVRDKRIEPVEFRGGGRGGSGGGEAAAAATGPGLAGRGGGTLSFETPGVQRLAFELPLLPGELSAANNRSHRLVKVLAQKLRVTLLSSTPSWDYRHLRDALGRWPWVELRGGIVASGAPPALGASELLAQDLVILHDVPPDALTLAQWDAVGALVRRGGSVLVVPGLSHARPVPAGHVLRELLPYDVGTRPAFVSWPGANPRFNLVPAADAWGLDLFKLDEDAEASRRRWEELPGFFRHLAIPAAALKPGARVLAVERQTQAPLLTELRVGAGRSLLLAMNETWRWRAKVGERDQERFFAQLVRHAVGEPYALTDGPLALDVDRVTVAPGQAVRVRARVTPPEGGAGATEAAGAAALLPPEALYPPSLELTVLQYGEAIRSVTLLPPAGVRDGRYEAFVSDLQEGEYDLEVTYEPPGWDAEAAAAAEAMGLPPFLPFDDAPPPEPVTLSLPLAVRAETERELADLSGNEAFLRRLAADTGGRFLHLDQVAQLPRLLEEARSNRPRTSEVRLWDSGYLFLFVLCCLTAEWSLRKRFGLA